MSDRERAVKAKQLLAQTTISGREYQRKKRVGEYKGSTIRKTKWFQAEELLDDVARPPTAPPTVPASRPQLTVRKVAFLTGDPINPRMIPTSWEHCYCADPNPSYRQHVTQENINASKNQGRFVTAWCGLLAKEHSGFDGPGARFAKGLADTGIVQDWIGQFESQAELNDSLYWGAKRLIGNPHSVEDAERALGTRKVWVPNGGNAPFEHTRKTLAQLIKDGEVAYTFEAYWNIPTWKPPKEMGAPIELPPDSLTIGFGRFDGGYRSVPEYQANSWPLEWPNSCAYFGGEAPDSDYRSLPV